MRAQESHVQVRLVAEQATVAAGDVFYLALVQDIAPHWHTYWKNPGDSGDPMRVTWTLPEGITPQGDLLWPAPKRIPYGPLVNYGFEERAVFLQAFEADADFSGGAFDVGVQTEILVCLDICIPEFPGVSLRLNDPERASSVSSGVDPSLVSAARAALPEDLGWSSVFWEEEGHFWLSLPDLPEDAQYVDFFPETWGVVKYPDPLIPSSGSQTPLFHQTRDSRPLSGVSSVPAVIVFEDDSGQRQAVIIEAFPRDGGAAAQPVSADAVTTNPERGSGLLVALAFALLGGIILNLMPCVFPVLSMKVLSLVGSRDKSALAASAHGMAYTAGILVSFGIVAAVLIALKSAGAQIGWGFQLQSPVVVMILTYLLFLIGLNLSGLFEIGGGFANAGQTLARKDGLTGSFFTGVLAMLVATPCTAPFMGVALGFALVQPPPVAMGIFLMLGFGLALPYLLFATIPPLRRILPRPGVWMEGFKHFLAFPMYGAAIWLVWVLSQQAGSSGVAGVLSGALLLVFGIWILRAAPSPARGKPLHPVRVLVRGLAFGAFILAALIPFGVRTLEMDAPKQSGGSEGGVSGAFGEAYSPESLSRALETNQPVFVEMTAAWCITCKLNHAVAIDIPATRALFDARGVVYLIGDWTKYDPQITSFLESYGRNGVPLYVYYGSPEGEESVRPEPVLLPQILTPGIVARMFGT